MSLTPSRRPLSGVGFRLSELTSRPATTGLPIVILESIQKAEFVIADLSHARPNVYFEVGYAHGLGKIPIYVASSDTKLEFDLKDYPVIFFKGLRELKDGLERDSGRFVRRKPRANSDIEADVALSRCAPSGPRSLMPVVMPTRPSPTSELYR